MQKPSSQSAGMNRRTALGLLAATASSVLLGRTSAAAPETPKRTGLGLVAYSCGIRRAALRRATPPVDLHEPAQFLQHCVSLGAGGMQVSLGVLDDNAAKALRRQVEQAGCYLEAIIGAPFEDNDVDRFSAQMKTAAAAGAKAARTTIIPGRRYEYFDSLEMFREFASRGRRALQRAAPIAEKHRLPLAVENHKDQRIAERVALFEHIGSQYVGACVDTGNSVALLEDPVETATALAPWAHAVHLKDQAVQLYDEGFLLGDIPLGQGFIDLKKVVAVLRERKPDVHFSLELITRDPLKVPVLADKYWATFPDLPARDLARMLSAVRAGATDNLQYPTRLSPDEQLALEDANVRASLDFARDQLNL